MKASGICHVRIKISFFMVILTLLSCTVLIFGASAGYMLDSPGLISRMDKYQTYGPYRVKNEYDDSGVFFSHSTKGRRAFAIGTDSGSWYGILRCFDPNIKSKYFLDDDRITEELKKFVEYDNEQRLIDGLPTLYRFVRYENVPRAECEKAVRKYCEDEKVPYANWIVEALYNDNVIEAMDALVSPDLIIDRNRYNSGEPKFIVSATGNGEHNTFILSPSQVLDCPIEELDGWGYSDKYWLDYYEFVNYLNSSSEEDSIVVMSSVYDKLDELSRRIDIYRSRVEGSPSTGDGTAARAAVFTVGVVLAAAVPALILTVKHRRKEK